MTDQPPPCQLCCSERLVLHYALRCPIYRCADCGLLVSRQAWDGTDTAAWYSAAFFDQDYWQTHSTGTSPDLPVYRQTLDVLAQQGLSRGRLLDVGCGLGVFLDVARQRGFEVQGTEVSAYAAGQVRERLGIPVFLGELAEAGYPPASFDVVALWDVLEHVPRPSDLLGRAARLLRAGGWLLVRAPNEDTLLNRVARCAYRLSGGRVKGPLQRMHEYYHLYYFSRAILVALMEKHGFRIVARWGGEVHLSRIAASAPVRWGMRAVYGLQALLDMQYEQVIVARQDGQPVVVGER